VVVEVVVVAVVVVVVGVVVGAVVKGRFVVVVVVVDIGGLAVVGLLDLSSKVLFWGLLLEGGF